MVQMRSVDDDVGASAMEVSQTDPGRQPTMARDNHPIFIGCSDVEASQTLIS